MPLAHIAQVVIRGRQDGQDYRNVVHFGSDIDQWDANTDQTLINLANAFLTCFVTHVMPVLANSFALEGVTAKRIFPAVTDEVLDDSGNGSAPVTTNALPSFCSMLMDIRTGGGGRRNRGRMFLPPPPEANIAANTLDPTILAALAAFAGCVAGKFIAPGATTPWRIGVLSRAMVNGSLPAINARFKEATSITPKPLVSVQRRRKIGKGS